MHFKFIFNIQGQLTYIYVFIQKMNQSSWPSLTVDIHIIFKALRQCSSYKYIIALIFMNKN